MCNASPQDPLRPANAGQRLEEVRPEMVEAVRASVGQLALGQRPHSLVRVQLGRIGGEVFEVQARELAARLTNDRTLVGPAVVPEGDDGAAKMTQKVSEEVADLGLADVLMMQTEVEPEPTPLRADGNAGDDRDLVAALPEVGERCLPAWRPGLRDARDQQEAGFVYEDEVGAQPGGVFLPGVSPFAPTRDGFFVPLQGQTLRLLRALAQPVHETTYVVRVVSDAKMPPDHLCDPRGCPQIGPVSVCQWAFEKQLHETA